MQRFILTKKNQDLYIEHSINPECSILILILEKEALWAENATFETVFDFFVFHQKKTKILYQFIVDNDDEDLEDEEVIEHRNMLKKAWKWFLHRYLLGNEPLPIEARIVKYEPEENDKFSIEDGYVYHNQHPIFRAKITLENPLSSISNLEFQENYSPSDLRELPRLMSELGGWLALNI